VSPTFKIADAFIEVHSKVNRNEFLRLSKSLLSIGPIVGALTADFAGLTAAAVSLVSSLGYSTLALAAAIPAAVGLGGAMLVMKMLFTETAGTPMDRFVRRMKDIQAELTRAVQGSAEVKRGFDKLLEGINKALPLTREFVLSLAASIGLAAGELGRMADSAGFMERLRTLMMGSAEASSYLAKMVDSVVDIIVTLGAAAVPVFTDLVKWLEEVLRVWQGWLIIKYQTGELTAMFKAAGEEAALWGKIVGNVLVGIVSLFNATHASGTRLAGTLLKITAAFRDWAQSVGTQSAIREFFDWILRVNYGEIHKIAASILAVGLAFRTIMGVQSAISAVLSLLTLGPVGIILAGVAVALSILAGAMTYAALHSQEFRDVMAGLFERLAAVALPLLEKLGPFFANLATTLVNLLVPAIEAALPWFLQMATVVGTFVQPIIDLLLWRLMELVPIVLDLALKIGALLGPAFMYVAGLALSLFNLLMEHGQPTLQTLGEWIVRVALWMSDYMAPVIAEVKLWWDALWQVIQNFVIPLLIELWATFAEKIGPALIGFRDNLLPQLHMAFLILSDAWRTNKQDLLELFEKFRVLFGYIIEYGIPIVGALVGVFVFALASAIRLNMQIAAEFNQRLKMLADGFETLRNIAVAAIDRIKGAWQGLINMASSVPGLSSILGRAHGGIIGGAAAGGVRSNLTMVGEAGPELVRLPAGARVRSNPDTERIMQGDGGGIVFNIHVAGSIQSERQFIKVVRDELINLGFSA
jgi:hypothetical protein